MLKISRLLLAALLILAAMNVAIGQAPPALHKETARSTATVVPDSAGLFLEVGNAHGIMLDKKYFIINYNAEWKIPNWVAYYIKSSDLCGGADRKKSFPEDTALPSELRARSSDYTDSNYDRGHNAPAGDFKRNEEAMAATFLMSNIAPQTRVLNRGIWNKLEGEVRKLVKRYGQAWIITGNICIDSKRNKIRPLKFIGKDSVAVPTDCFKAILAERDNGQFEMYAFLLKNQQTKLSGPMDRYRLTVDSLETITGFDFFPRLDDILENRLESRMPEEFPPDRAVRHASRK